MDAPQQTGAPARPSTAVPTAGDGGLPVIDPVAWSEYMAPLGEAADEIVGLWLRELDARVAAIAHAAGLRDADALATAAHTLRGSSTYVGAARLANGCSRIEGLLRLGAPWPSIEALLPAVRRDAADARRALRAVAGPNDAPLG
jgi:HPt (histidine-containing phosphotransfer) domain-containing protein